MAYIPPEEEFQKEWEDAKAKGLDFSESTPRQTAEYWYMKGCIQGHDTAGKIFLPHIGEAQEKVKEIGDIANAMSRAQNGVRP